MSQDFEGFTLDDIGGSEAVKPDFVSMHSILDTNWLIVASVTYKGRDQDKNLIDKVRFDIRRPNEEKIYQTVGASDLFRRLHEALSSGKKYPFQFRVTLEDNSYELELWQETQKEIPF